MRTMTLFLLTALALPALADDPKGTPTRKHGLWEMNMETGGHRMTMRHCVGPGTDSVSHHQGGPNAGGPNMRKQQNCSKNNVSRQSGKVVVDSVCQHGGSTVTTHAEFTGDFNTGYRADMHSRFDPPMRGMKETKQVMTMRWLGPCKPGQKPGDVEMQMPGQEGRGGPAGFNMQDLMNRMKR